MTFLIDQTLKTMSIELYRIWFPIVESVRKLY